MNAEPRRQKGLAGVEATVDDLIRLRFRAQRLDLGSVRRAREALAGPHLSRFRGRGMEFAESRAYLPGDDVRNIDWRVTARTGRPHTKLFQEERERPVILLVDLGPSMHFGTRVAFKTVVATEAAALIAWAALARGDRVGALVAGCGEHRELKPKSGRRGVLGVLRALALLGQAKRRDPDQHALEGALLRARHVARPGSLIIMLSDFYTLGDDTERHLSRLRQHNDMLACWIHDPLEVRPPPPGRYPVSDGWQTATLDITSKRSKDRYIEHFRARHDHVRTTLGRLGIALIPIAAGDDVAEALNRGLSGMPSEATEATPP